jgi:uncharacterized protein
MRAHRIATCFFACGTALAWFNDPALRATNFVIVHGGGVFSAHAGAMLWKPNLFVDMSAMTRLYTPDHLDGVLKEWLSQFPNEVLFGSDASPAW